MLTIKLKFGVVIAEVNPQQTHKALKDCTNFFVLLWKHTLQKAAVLFYVFSFTSFSPWLFSVQRCQRRESVCFDLTSLRSRCFESRRTF